MSRPWAYAVISGCFIIFLLSLLDPYHTVIPRSVAALAAAILVGVAIAGVAAGFRDRG